MAKQELKVELFDECIGEIQRQTEGQRLALQDAQHGFVESRREEVRLQELSMKKGSQKYSNPKYARNGRNEKSSRTAS